MEADFTGARPRKAWALSPQAWTIFLRRLNEDSEKAGQEYEALRARLITTFRCRGLPDPAGLADDAIDRIVKGLEREEIRDIFAYAAGVARHIASEAFRRPPPVSLADVQAPPRKQSSDDSQETETDRRLNCLTQCTASLNESDRDLISNWYEHEKGQKVEDKRRLAANLGIALGALRVRAYRIRERIRACVIECVARSSVTFSEESHQ
jgi:DNA-directed RNA polymerase specialized sigma24 family protein